jgi:biopolymer transport protein ExbD
MSTPGSWQVRIVGQPDLFTVEAPQKVLDGLRDGLWDTSDEVRGPGETLWAPIEDHPTFVEPVAEMGPPPPPPHDETHLDMNPLIDVALVLLIFFILTSSVATLRRMIELPPPQSDDKAAPVPKKEDVVDRVFNVKITLAADEKPVVSINDRVIVYEQLDKEMKDIVKTTGRKEMYLAATDDVTWDTLVQVIGAANEAGVVQIHTRNKK